MKFAVKCWQVDFLMPCKSRSGENSKEKFRMVRALLQDTFIIYSSISHQHNCRKYVPTKTNLENRTFGNLKFQKPRFTNRSPDQPPMAIYQPPMKQKTEKNENTVKVKKLVFKLKFIGFRDVREEATDHTQLYSRNFTGSGLTGPQKVNFSTIDGKLHHRMVSKPSLWTPLWPAKCGLDTLQRWCSPSTLLSTQLAPIWHCSTVD